MSPAVGDRGTRSRRQSFRRRCPDVPSAACRQRVFPIWPNLRCLVLAHASTTMIGQPTMRERRLGTLTAPTTSPGVCVCAMAGICDRLAEIRWVHQRTDGRHHVCGGIARVVHVLLQWFCRPAYSSSTAMMNRACFDQVSAAAAPRFICSLIASTQPPSLLVLV